VSRSAQTTRAAFRRPVLIVGGRASPRALIGLRTRNGIDLARCAATI